MGEVVAEVEVALERLFRLVPNRSLHARQAQAVGAKVTRAGFSVLRCVADAEVDGRPCSLGAVARSCVMDPATAGRQVRILDDDGLVASATSDEDGRVTTVALTDRGRAVYRDIVEVRTEFVGQVLADWSRTDQADLVRLVDRLVADLGAVEFRPGTSTRRRSARRGGVAR